MEKGISVLTSSFADGDTILILGKARVEGEQREGNIEQHGAERICNYRPRPNEIASGELHRGSHRDFNMVLTIS